MTPQQEAAFEKKSEKMLAGHRGLQDGRDFRWNVERFRSDVNNKEFDQNYDRTFPDAPGSPGWFDRKFGGKPQ